MRYGRCLFLWLLPLFLSAQPRPDQGLSFAGIPGRWEEALPLGNGILGCLIWQKDGRLRLSLDRADLWDLRPMQGLDRPEFTYQWVAEQVAKGEYGIVQQYFDAPYEREAGPTKLPGGALEFSWPGQPMTGVRSGLDISTGLASIEWPGGARFESFVHAEKREGWFRFSGMQGFDQAMKLLAPAYARKREPGETNSVQGSDLARLGYIQSEPFERRGVWLFHQPGWGGFSYEVAVCVRPAGQGIWEGVWSISSHFTQKTGAPTAESMVRRAIRRGFDRSFAESRKWWTRYWAQSSVSVPDSLIERQYVLDLYKFGCVARENGPMISLQAVWTADNGRLPPWKGDLHHDLNTQMSYWPAYASNHLREGLSYLKHLESNEAAHLDYTKQYFGTSGLNLPGVSTLLGEEMGGWIQYACSPTVAAWCAQHFYLHWRYSMDRRFLRYHAWPWFQAVAVHLRDLSSPQNGGARVLPLSSSPEFYDNSLKAWFPNAWTNYDLALARFVFDKTAELAGALGKTADQAYWHQVAAELPALAREPGAALEIAPGLPYRESHRHFSHLMAIYPLGQLSWENETDRRSISASLALLDSVGPANWCGYSYAWLASLRARARDGLGAREALRIFAEAFVSKNSFHLNGDQSDKDYSTFHYDPFTLEGNFAFAAGVQEMLLQSHDGVIRILPAVPADWKNLAFTRLRAEGACLVSVQLSESRPCKITIEAEKSGELKVELPPGEWRVERRGPVTGRYWQGVVRKGEQVVFWKG